MALESTCANHEVLRTVALDVKATLMRTEQPLRLISTWTSPARSRSRRRRRCVAEPDSAQASSRATVRTVTGGSVHRDGGIARVVVGGFNRRSMTHRK